MTPLEIAANLATTASIFLAARNSVHTWWTGIVGCALFVLLFYRVQLYADVVLQVFFVVASAAGWWQWLRGDEGRPLPVTHAAPAALAFAGIGGVAAAACYGALLHRFTDAYAPFVDSAVLVFSAVAQLLLMKRRVEAWGALAARRYDRRAFVREPRAVSDGRALCRVLGERARRMVCVAAIG